MCTLVTFEGVDSCRGPRLPRTALVGQRWLLPHTDQPGPSRIDPHTDPDDKNGYDDDDEEEELTPA